MKSKKLNRSLEVIKWAEEGKFEAEWNPDDASYITASLKTDDKIKLWLANGPFFTNLRINGKDPVSGNVFGIWRFIVWTFAVCPIIRDAGKSEMLSAKEKEEQIFIKVFDE